MTAIKVIQNPDEALLDKMGVYEWPVWEKEVSCFPWTYESRETCYILDGEAVVSPDGGDPVTIRAGEIVIFPSGMSCSWDVRSPVRKHYCFD